MKVSHVANGLVGRLLQVAGWIVAIGAGGAVIKMLQEDSGPMAIVVGCVFTGFGVMVIRAGNGRLGRAPKREPRRPASQGLTLRHVLLGGLVAIVLLALFDEGGRSSQDQAAVVKTAVARSHPGGVVPASALALSEPRTDGPDQLVEKLKFVGLEDGLGGRGWHKSSHDDKWIAIVRLPFGPNEVSCLLESTRPDVIQDIELEAEFYEPHVQREAALIQFAKALAAIYPEAPRELLEAVAAGEAWSNGEARLSLDAYDNGGHGIRFNKP